MPAFDRADKRLANCPEEEKDKAEAFSNAGKRWMVMNTPWDPHPVVMEDNRAPAPATEPKPPSGPSLRDEWFAQCPPEEQAKAAAFEKEGKRWIIRRTPWDPHPIIVEDTKSTAAPPPTPHQIH